MAYSGRVTQLVTGDAVLLDLRPARVPTRMLATVIDLALMGGLTFLYGYIVSRVTGSSAQQTLVSLIGSILITFGYPIITETLTRGRTLGALALGLRVVRDDGGAIRFRHALLRGLAFWTIDFAIWTGFCGGLICAAVNPQSKRLGDLVAGTLVIRVRAPRRPDPLPETPDHLRPWAAQLELSGLPDELVTASRQLVQRSNGLLRFPREQLASDLARQVAAKVTPPPPQDLEPVEFLAAVVNERRLRETTRVRRHQEWVPTAAELPQGWR